MAKEEFSQLELFSQIKDNKHLSSQPSNAFLNFIWTYEKIILIIIGFVISGIVAFSLGVERGKKIAMPKSDSHFELAETKPLIKTEKAKQIQQVIQPKEEKKPIIEKQTDLVYTIQVASYKSKAQAQKIAEGLKKKGLTVKVMPKSEYSIVCIGSFSKKEKAQTLLSELRKQYKDCFLRRL